jgi:preprotein translocase subunit SecG
MGDGKSPILQNEPLKVLWRLFIWGAAFFFAVEVLLLFMQSRKKSKENQ